MYYRRPGMMKLCGSQIARLRWIALGTAMSMGGLISGGVGCGYTEEQWLAQLDKYDRLQTKERAGEEKLDQISSDFEVARLREGELEGKMKALGIDLDAKNVPIGELSANLKERDRALSDLKIHIRQMEELKIRFEVLRSKLEDVAKQGVEVRVRKNRLLISLPGDALFDNGSDTLRKPGRDLLARVGAVLAADSFLSGREYQVAGHVDSKSPKGGGAFGDNWGLSAMRARRVVVFLTDPKEGNLPAEHFSAAGYGDTDPIAPDDSEAGRQANRRLELVIVPTPEEVLDLRPIAALATEPPVSAPATPPTGPAAHPTVGLTPPVSHPGTAPPPQKKAAP